MSGRACVAGVLFCALPSLLSQSRDTVTIGPANVNPKVLRPGVHRYLVYFRLGKDSTRTRFQLWTRAIEQTSFRGRPAIRVLQEWEDNDTIFHRTNSVCDAATFAPLYQESWWRTRPTKVHDFPANEAWVDGRKLTPADTSLNDRRNIEGFAAARKQFCLNWHLDLETFPQLPFTPNTTYRIPFYEAGYAAPEYVNYDCIGSDVLPTSDGRNVDCWLLRHSDSPRSIELFWISKETREVLKLEQEFDGRFRYKLKLPFSV